jgi:hypothetical protein
MKDNLFRAGSVCLVCLMTRKRKSDSSAADGGDDSERGKRKKFSSTVRSQPAANRDAPEKMNIDAVPDARNEGKGKEPATATTDDNDDQSTLSSTRTRNKLKPPRPFPTVPTSVSATGPRSAHHEGKNYICVTRRTSLGAYMRRCKDLIIKDGCELFSRFSFLGISHLLNSW